MKFKVGDKVRILDGRTIRPRMVTQTWVGEMDALIGKITTVDSFSIVREQYQVVGSLYWFDENWLEPVTANLSTEIDIEALKSELKDAVRALSRSFGMGRSADTESNKELRPRHIYKGGRKLVVLWRDGTKTIVERAEDEPDSAYAAFTAALAIKIYGSNSRVRKIVETTEEPQKKKKKAQKGQKDKK